MRYGSMEQCSAWHLAAGCAERRSPDGRCQIPSGVRCNPCTVFDHAHLCNSKQATAICQTCYLTLLVKVSAPEKWGTRGMQQQPAAGTGHRTVSCSHAATFVGRGRGGQPGARGDQHGPGSWPSRDRPCSLQLPILLSSFSVACGAQTCAVYACSYLVRRPCFDWPPPIAPEEVCSR